MRRNGAFSFRGKWKRVRCSSAMRMTGPEKIGARETILSRGKAQLSRLNRMLALLGFMHGGCSGECESLTMKLANGGVETFALFRSRAEMVYRARDAVPPCRNSGRVQRQK